MKQSRMTKAQLIEELAACRRRVSTLEGKLEGTRHRIPGAAAEDARAKAATARAPDDQLLESKRFLQTVIDAIPEMTLVVDREHHILLANRAAREAAGVDPVAQGLPCHEVAHHPSIPCNSLTEKCPLEQVIATKGPVTVRHIHRDAADREVAVEITAAPILDDNGEVVQMIETCRDITARRETERALRENEQLLRTIVDATQDAMIPIGEDGLITLFSRAAEEMFGRSAAEMIGQPVDGLMPEEYRQRHSSFVKSYFATGKPDRALRRMLEVHGLRSNGEVFPMEISLTAGSVGEERFVLGVARDITERKRAEEALGRQEEQLRTLVNATQEAIISMGEDGLITLFNRAAGQMFGRSAEEMIGQPPDSLMPKEYRERHAEYVRSFFGTGKPNAAVGRFVELPGLRRSGEVFPMEVSLTAGRAGERQFVTAVARDITERKQAEEARRHRAAFDSLITAISTRFINLPVHAVDQEIDSALGQVGEFAGVDRSYVFQFSADGRLMTNTHEWCAAGIASMKHRLIDLPADAIPWFTERIRRPETVHVPRVADLGPEAAGEKEEWEAESIQSLICVPMVCGGTLLGFVGFDSVRAEKTWPDEIIALLRIVGDILANCLARQKSEEALRESQRALATLMSNLPGMAYRCRNDPDWTMEFVSDGCLNLTGYEPSSLLNNAEVSYADLIHPDDQQAVWDEVQAGVNSNRPFRLVYRIVTASGQQKWVWEQGRGVFSGTGDLLALEGFINDITEQKQAEEALQASELRFRALVETTSDWVWETDRDGRYSYASPKIKELLGYAPEEVIGKTPFELMRPAQAKRVARTLKRLAARQEPFMSLEHSVVSKDGNLVTMETSGVPVVDSHGALVGYRGIDRDITRRKRAEEALRRSERLASLGTTVAGVAHELNNPLTSICGLAQLLTRNRSLGPEAAGLAKDIWEQGRRCSGTVENLLGFARERPVTRRKVALNELIDRCLRLTRPDPRFAGVEINTEYCPDLPPIMADPYQIEQVLINILINAGDAMAEASREKRLVIRTRATDDNVSIEVQDSGPGIFDPGRVFDPFYTTKRTGSGTGLGLSVSYGIVQEHGGSITAENAKGGARFVVRLPLVPPARPDEV